MNRMPIRPKDTNAWVMQVWASFVVSFAAAGFSIAYAPVDSWVRAQLGVTFLYATTSAFTLSKTVRDNHEASKIVSRIDEAKIEKLLAQHDPLLK
jgi:hypothetical protein